MKSDFLREKRTQSEGERERERTANLTFKEININKSFSAERITNLSE